MEGIGRKIVIGIVACMMFALTGCGKTVVSLNDYITITSTGYDSKGTASVDFDKDAFLEDYEGKIKLAKKSSEMSELGLLIGETPAEMLYEFCIGKGLDKSTELSNGDEITLKWYCDDALAEENFNVTLEYEEIPYTVENLQQITKFNPFNNLTVTFSGIDPDGIISLNAANLCDEMESIYFTASKNSGIRMGEKVTVTAHYYGDEASFISRYGSVLSETTKEYECKDLGYYITDVEDIPKEVEKQFIELGKKAFLKYVNQCWNTPDSVIDITCVQTYFLHAKEQLFGYPDNYLFLVYKIQAQNPDPDQVVEFYYYVGYSSIVKRGLGGYEADLDNYIVPNPSIFGSEIFYVGNYFYSGYENLDDLYNYCVTRRADSYYYDISAVQP